MLIAIDGPAGSGKTTLAGRLADDVSAAGRSVHVLHLDAFYPGWDGLERGVTDLVDQVLLPVSRGEAAAYRPWNWHAGRHDDPVRVPEADVLIVEGCGAATGQAGTLADLRIWVDAPAEVRRARAIARDGETFAPHWDRWAAQEDALYAADDTRARCDVEITTGRGASGETE